MFVNTSMTWHHLVSVGVPDVSAHLRQSHGSDESVGVDSCRAIGDVTVRAGRPVIAVAWVRQTAVVVRL